MALAAFQLPRALRGVGAPAFWGAWKSFPTGINSFIKSIDKMGGGQRDDLHIIISML